MNIAFFADNFLPQVNGVVTSVLNLSHGLAKKGHKILIIAPKYSNYKYPEFHPNIKVITVMGVPALIYPQFKFTSIFNPKILEAINKEQIQILHFNAPMTLAFQAILFSKLLKLPLVGTFHTFFSDAEYLKHVKLDNKLFESASWQYSNLFYNRCDLITCPSESAKNELIKHNANGKIKIISNGIDPKLFDNSNSPEFRSKHTKNGPLLLYVGRVSYDKNIDTLLDAFKIINKKIPESKLLIVGDGPQFEDYSRYSEELGLKKSVTFLGETPYEKLTKSGFYKACDLFITASKTETQGITLLEAMANSLPCVGVRAKGIPYLIEDNKNGLIAEPNNPKDLAAKALKILTDPSLKEHLRKSTPATIKKHLMQNVIKTWEKTYMNLLKKK